MEGDEDELPMEVVNALKAGYNPPPPTPAEEMWGAIESAISAGSTPGSGDVPVVPIATRSGGRRGRLPGWVGLAAAAGLALLIGVGIGRRTAPEGTTAPSVAEAPATAESVRGQGNATAAARHVGDIEPLLRQVRAELRRGGGLDGQIGLWSRDLLRTTRLLMDRDPESVSPGMRRLLEDLEFVLVQVRVLAEGGLPAERLREELELLDEELESTNVFPRIQAFAPNPGIIHAGS